MDYLRLDHKVEFGQKLSTWRRLFVALFLLCGFGILFVYTENCINFYYDNDFVEFVQINTTEYLVYSPECKIPNFDPFNKQAMQFYKYEKYVPCNKYKLLSYIEKKNNVATLYINKSSLSSYTRRTMKCCISYINRGGTDSEPDNGFQSGPCKPFKNNITLLEDTVKVTCKLYSREIYSNVHEAITIKDGFRNVKNDSKRPPSILFIGIDSISRLNLIRAMPKTYSYLTNNSEDWTNLLGYNKIDDNTFPNLMAIFTGYNNSEAYSSCNPKKIGQLDGCRFIWKEFIKNGYVTAYAEDDAPISTFNYRKKGFTKPPVHHYFRPYVLAAESLGTTSKEGLIYCSGPETSGERIMNLAKDFAVTYKDHPSFGFFWMNTFSHNYINGPSRMDEKVRSLLEHLTNNGVMENSIVIFLSDHGIRFGEIRYTFSGWLEERLPFIYFSFPKWFKQKFPTEVENFVQNSNRLTTPYDLHLTLQHILVLSGFKQEIPEIDTCPRCTSLFYPVEKNRSCESSAITPHWCTCGGYSMVDPKDRMISEAALYVLDEIQEIIRKRRGAKKCAKFSIKRILTSYVSEKFSYKNDTYLLLVIQMKPHAVFESTVNFKLDAKNQSVFSRESGISRLDSYGSTSRCVGDEYLKEYCYCR